MRRYLSRAKAILLMICWILLRWCCLVARSCHCKQYMLSKGIVDASFDGVEDVSSMALTKRSIGLNARCGDDAQQMCLLPTLAVIWIRAEVPRVKAPKTRLPRDTRLDTDCTLGGNHNNHNTRTAMALLVDKHRPRSSCLVDLQC